MPLHELRGFAPIGAKPLSSLFIPKLIGSRFRVPACPGATGCGYAIVFSVYDFFAFHHRILTCQVWARGSRVTT